MLRLAARFEDRSGRRKEELSMSKFQLKSIIAFPVASAIILSMASSGMAAQPPVQLPSGWKTVSELYAKIAKLPPDQVDQVLYQGAKQEGAVSYACTSRGEPGDKADGGLHEKIPGH
jgi:hypothetical protein